MDSQNSKINITENKLWNNTIEALEDDLNTPLVITYLYEAMKEVNKTKSAPLAQEILKILKLLAVVPKAETLDSLYEKQINKIPENIKELIHLRVVAKEKKDFNQADKLREEIHSLGWEIKAEKTGIIPFHESFSDLKSARMISDHLPIYFNFSLN